MKPYFVLNWAVGGDEENLGRLDVNKAEEACRVFKERKDAGDHVTLEAVSMEGRKLIDAWPEDLRELYEKNG